VALLCEVDYQMIPPLLPLITTDFNSHPAAVARAVPIYSLASAVFCLLFGYLSDRWGRRPFIAGGLVCFSGAALLARLAGSLEMFLTARFLAGLTTGAIITSATSYVADYFPYERRGRAMGMLSTAYFAAAVLGIPTATAVAPKLGWRPLFVFISASALLLGVLTRHLLAEKQSNETQTTDRFSLSHLRRMFWIILKSQGTLSVLVASMLASAAIVSFITFLGSHLNLNLNLPVQRVGLVFLLSGLTSLIGAPLSGFASDRVKKKTLLVGSGFLLACILAIIPNLSLSLGLLILLGLAGFTVAFRMAPLLALTTELVASNERGTLLAVRSAVSSSGIAAATLAASYLYQSGGYRAVGLFAASLVLLSTFLILFFVIEPGSPR